jgi:predicted kinase
MHAQGQAFPTARKAAERIAAMVSDGTLVVALLGAPGAGKSTIARLVKEAVERKGREVLWIDLREDLEGSTMRPREVIEAAGARLADAVARDVVVIWDALTVWAEAGDWSPESQAAFDAHAPEGGVLVVRVAARLTQALARTEREGRNVPPNVIPRMRQDVDRAVERLRRAGIPVLSVSN